MKKIILILLVLLALFGVFFVFKYDSGTLQKSVDTSEQEQNYRVKIISDVSNIQPNTKVNLEFILINNQNEIVKNFDIAHEKLLHLIVVRKDLQHFQHLHPELNTSTGNFSVNIIFPNDGPYRIYADFVPAENNSNDLPVTAFFDITAGNIVVYKPLPTKPDEDFTEKSGPYTVDQYFLDVLTAGYPATYNISVDLPNELVQLEPYLGAMGHSVIIKADTLEYIHAHAASMSMEGMENMSASEHMHHQAEPNTLEFTATFPTTGMYKIFTQFQHQSKVNTVDYVIEVKQ